MANVFFLADLHIGHRRILEFSPQRGVALQSIDEHDEWIVSQWNSVVGKRDMVWVLGDVCFDAKKLCFLDRMAGRKVLIAGNHDTMMAREYLAYFEEIHGLWSKYGLWMSHAPIHPNELRDRPNVHGHLHHKKLPDRRFLNVSVEQLNGIPVDLFEVRERLLIRND